MKKILSISFTFALVLAFTVPQVSFAMSTFESSTQTGTEVKTVTIATLQSQIAALTAQLEGLKAMLSKQRDSVRPNTNDVYNQAKPLTQPITSHGCAPGEKFDTRTGERCVMITTTIQEPMHVEHTEVVPTLTTAPTVNADVTGNGIVNIDDLLSVINHWGACPIIDPAIAPVARYAACTSDIDHDGMVGQADMKLVQDNWTH